MERIGNGAYCLPRTIRRLLRFAAWVIPPLGIGPTFRRIARADAVGAAVRPDAVRADTTR